MRAIMNADKKEVMEYQEIIENEFLKRIASGQNEESLLMALIKLSVKIIVGLKIMDKPDEARDAIRFFKEMLDECEGSEKELKHAIDEIMKKIKGHKDGDIFVL